MTTCLGDVAEVTAGVPFMDMEQAETLRHHIRRHDIRDVLELGFAHGVSSCYLAASLKEQGRGHLTTVDRRRARDRDPNIEELARRLDLTEWITPVYAHTTFTWELMKLLEEDQTPRFDLCYFDGGHSWDDTGFGFLLVDRLLRPEGWVLFDDMDWTYAASPTLSDLDWVQAMSEEERTTPQVRKVYELLVRPPPHCGDLRTTRNGSWGWARKRLRLTDRLGRLLRGR
jgi:predicted O-methyltransferase YrrM